MARTLSLGRYLWCAVLLAALPACGSSDTPASPTSPTTGSPPTTSPLTPADPATTQDFLGVWSGAWAVERATARGFLPGETRQFQLRLESAGGGVDGYILLTSAGNVHLTGNVAGMLTSDHRLAISGTTPAAGTTDHGLQIQLLLWFTAGQIQGHVIYDDPNASPVPEHATATVLEAMRGLRPADSYAGTWRGRFLIRTCDRLLWDHCYGGEVGETLDVELTLTQAGAVVSGTFWPTYSPSVQPGYIYDIPVAGTVSGGSLHLSGESLPYPFNPDVTRRLLSLDAVRDPVGRLAGTLTWQDDSVGSGSANLGQLNRLTRAGDLYEVVQMP